VQHPDRFELAYVQTSVAEFQSYYTVFVRSGQYICLICKKMRDGACDHRKSLPNTQPPAKAGGCVL
jgi:hypothetical protein